MSSRANNTRDTASGSIRNSNENGTINISASSMRKNSTFRLEQASSSFQNFLDEQDNAFNEFARRIMEARQNITGYSKAYADIEKTMDQLSHLRLIVSQKDIELQKKNTEIEHLNSIRQTMRKDYRDEYDKWKQQLKKLQTRIEELESTSKEANARAAAAESTQARLKEMLLQLEDTGKKTAKTEQKLRKAEDKGRDLQRQLDQSTDRLREWDEYISVLEDVDLVSL